MSLMISSIIHEVRPNFSRKRKRIRDVVDRAYPRSMEDLAAEVKVLFEEPLQIQTLFEISEQLQDEYHASLKSSDISMLPSYQDTLPTGAEQGDFLALDVGGSTLRIALIRLNGRKYDGNGLEARRVRSFAIEEAIRQLNGPEFFNWIATRIGEMLAEYNHMTGTTDAHLQMGLAWSFPVEQTSLRTGRLLAMGKGFCAAQEFEGKDLGELLTEACRHRGLNVELCAIVNDSSATLLSQAYRDPATRMSLILGTGVNAAAFLPTTALGAGKFGTRPDEWLNVAKHVVVNTEMSMFGRHVLPKTRWDEDLNSKHLIPDFQPLEYLTTGRYLGEISRLILLEAITTTGLFNGKVPERLDVPYAVDTRLLATFENDKTIGLTEAKAALLIAHPMQSQPKPRDLRFLRDVARLVSRRAAAYLATALHALWAVHMGAEDRRPGDAHHVTIACDGSMIEKYPGFQQLLQHYLDRLCVLSGAEKGAVTLEVTPKSSIFGAAVAVSCSS